MTTTTQTETATTTDTVQANSTQNLLKDRVTHYMTTVKESIGGPQLDQELNTIGAKSTARIAELRGTMQVSVDAALPSLGKDSELAKIINEATIKTTELNPNSVTNGLMYKLLPIPAVRKFLMRGYVENFQSESGKVQTIFDNLIGGKEHLLEKMIMLQNQYRDLKETVADVDADIIMTTQLQEELTAQDTTGFDDSEKEKYERALNRVARKHRDLETKKAAINQFFMSIDQTFNVQQMLTDSIDSVLDVGPLVLQNAIMLHSAIDAQRQVAEAAKNAQSAIAGSLEANARLMKTNASEVAELYNNPVIAMESFEKSFQDLVEAMNITREAQAKGTEIAVEMTKGLKVMNEKFTPTNDALDDDMSGSVTIDGESKQV
jgi:uncharacterized protein YaaN involved in tellurite resistance|tara:strand:+ start:37 stop:1167 length:1131 start_codon:yes stop_codon:yes gene_type:complete